VSVCVCVCGECVWSVIGGGVCVHVCVCMCVCVTESNISTMILHCVVPLCLSHTARWIWCCRHNPDDSVNAQVYPVLFPGYIPAYFTYLVGWGLGMRRCTQ